MIQTLLDFEIPISQEDIFNSKIFNLPKKQLKISSLKSNWITFENCTFNCDSLTIEKINNPDLTLIFRNCTFNCSVNFRNCNFDQLTINDTLALA